MNEERDRKALEKAILKKLSLSEEHFLIIDGWQALHHLGRAQWLVSISHIENSERVLKIVTIEETEIA